LTACSRLAGRGGGDGGWGSGGLRANAVVAHSQTAPASTIRIARTFMATHAKTEFVLDDHAVMH
jgi:hypothetical protein